MRVIKFRGKKNSIWYKGNLIQRTLHTGTVYFIASFETPEIENAVEESTVGQFTGLKDKNNVEIYEGDILADSNGNEFVAELWAMSANTLDADVLKNGIFKFKLK